MKLLTHSKTSTVAHYSLWSVFALFYILLCEFMSSFQGTTGDFTIIFNKEILVERGVYDFPVAVQIPENTEVAVGIYIPAGSAATIPYRNIQSQTCVDGNNSLIARFMGPTWGPSGANRTQVGPILPLTHYTLGDEAVILNRIDWISNF